MVRENVATDAMERLFKAGNIIKTKLQVDANGDIYQHGQKMDDVHKNAYQMMPDDPIITPRTKAEANNGARIKYLREQGYLKDYVYVVMSMCAEGVSDKELDERNFFSLTKSMSLQATWEDDGILKGENAFVAGVADEHSERHDRELIERFGARLGVDYRGKSAAQIIDGGMLIPKSEIPNGVVDVVKELDEDNGGTFFGQNKPVQDYVEFKEFCRKREASFEHNIDEITDALIAEAGKFANPTEASKRLGKLVEARMVKRAIKDESIDIRIFGEDSAQHIETARELESQGMYQQAAQQVAMAQQLAKSGSCPSAMNTSSLSGIVNPLKVQMELNIDEKIRAEKGWHGGWTKEGTCVSCDEEKTVGVDNYCRECISC